MLDRHSRLSVPPETAFFTEVALPRSMPWKGQALEAVHTSAVDCRSRNANAEELAFLESSLRDDLVRFGYSKR
jgi:hypothetical protein